MALLKNIESQMPTAICEQTPGSINRNLIVNRDKPPFDNPDLRRAMALTLDRKAFIDIISDGKGEIGGVMQPAPAGIWGMPADLLKSVPGYDPDVEKNRAQARRIMEGLGYGPNNRLQIKVTTPRHSVFPRPGGDPDRPSEGGLYRRCDGND